MKKQIILPISPEHPAFAGHFPGTPIVPGVVLLDEVLHALGTDIGLVATDWQISSVKFLSPLTPGEPATMEYEQLANDSIKFEVQCAGLESTRQIVIGSLTRLKALEH
jgi:3-hydroxyacyl-[acyl-carrier-protein] dehydratase